MPDSAPRLSINQLAEYLAGSPTQRRRVLFNAKNRPAFMVKWYEPARQCIVDFLLNGMADEGILLREIERLLGLRPTNENEGIKNRTNAEALESVLGNYDQLEFLGLTPTRGANSQPRLSVSNVEISVRPEIILSGEYKGTPTVGALKLYISKDRLNEVTAPYVASVVHQHVEAHHAKGADARLNACAVFDVFAGSLTTAPNAVTRRRKDIAAACEEIALVWPSVEEKEPFQRGAADQGG